MPLLQVLITLIVIGVLLWLVNTYIPMAGSIKSILNDCGRNSGCALAAEYLWASSLPLQH